MDVQANLASSVHLCCLAFQLWQLYLWRYCWVRGGDVKAEVELVLDEVVHVPALALPRLPPVDWLYREPVHICLLVDLNVLDERRELLRAQEGRGTPFCRPRRGRACRARVLLLRLDRSALRAGHW